VRRVRQVFDLRDRDGPQRKVFKLQMNTSGKRDGAFSPHTMDPVSHGCEGNFEMRVDPARPSAATVIMKAGSYPQCCFICDRRLWWLRRWLGIQIC
jgi:hypothetical protein